MEKVTTNNLTNENLSLNNRKNLILEGIVEIISSNDNNIYVKLKDTTLFVTGSNIHITKLDVSLGTLHAEGVFDSFKYGKTNFIKRIFK